MSKTKYSHVWQTLLVSVLILILVGCGVSTFKATPTAPPPYLHYTPSEESDIHLEFDYPSSWVFRESKMEDIGWIIIGLGDQRFLTLPTPVDTHPTPNDYGSIDIFIFPPNPGQTPDTELQLLKQIYSKHSWMTVRADYKVMIDGYDTNVLEYQTNDPESSPSLMFNRRIFFVIEDQFYEILYTVAEKDRGGEFEQGYEYFFNSLEIVP